MAIGDNISKVTSTAADVAATAAAAKAKAEAAKKKAKELADKAQKAKEFAEKQKAKAEQLKKSLADKQNFLKEQAKINPADAKAAIIAVVLPLLTKFINAEKVANAIINKLIRKTKNKLKDKGRVEINGGSIVFYPKNYGDYSRYKRDFDRKVSNLKRTINTLKSIIDKLVTILKILKIALAAFKVYLGLLKKKINALAIASAAELSSPSQSKPITARYNIEKIKYDEVVEPLKQKINDYILMITVVQSILQIFQKMVNSIKIKLDSLSLTINSSPFVTNADLQATINSDPQTTDTEYNNGTTNYTIEVITTPSGALQAVAYDSFSRMKITQTAPSKFRKADELINELKQILG